MAAFIIGLMEIFHKVNSTLEQATDVHLRRSSNKGKEWQIFVTIID